MFLMNFAKLICLTKENLNNILHSKRIMYLPTTILPHLTNEEIMEFKQILKIDELKDSTEKPSWYDEIAAAGN